MLVTRCPQRTLRIISTSLCRLSISLVVLACVDPDPEKGGGAQFPPKKIPVGRSSSYSNVYRMHTRTHTRTNEHIYGSSWATVFLLVGRVLNATRIDASIRLGDSLTGTIRQLIARVNGPL